MSYLVALPSRVAIIRGHQASTLEWWNNVLPLVRAFVSPAVIAEASRGDAEEVRKRLAALSKLQTLEGNDDVVSLAATYVARRLIPESSAFDALHLAYAVHHGVDYLLTWNCRHLASAVVRRRIVVLNAELGRATPTLCTPEELMEV